MLVRITNKCDMGCSHCMIETSTTDDTHMDFETINALCSYIEEVKPSMIVLSGGEPSEHPYFLQIIDRILESTSRKSIFIDVNGLPVYTKVIIASNGKFLEDVNLTEQLLKRDVEIQVTNDSRYYPKKINAIKHESNKINYFNKIGVLYPLGKAVDIEEDLGTFSGPKCFNVRSIVKSKANNMRELVQIMEYEMYKWCYLSIDYDGTVRGGESNRCFSLGNIKDGSTTIYNNIKKMKLDDCNKCGLVDNLGIIHKAVIY